MDFDKACAERLTGKGPTTLQIRVRLTRGSLTLRIRIGPVPKYLKENPGSPLILTFILSLIVAAATYSFNATLANDIVTNTFLLLIAGVILQVIALAKKGSQEELEEQQDHESRR